MPASPEELGYHELLLKKDPQASAIVCDRYLGEIYDRLKRANPPIDPDIALEAVVDALMSYVLNPEQYKPNLKSLRNFLFMAAAGDLKNKLARLSRKAEKEMPLIFDVGNDSETGNELVDEIEMGGEADPDYIELRDKVMVMGNNLQEQGIIELMIANERDYFPYAQILGILDKTVTEQRQQVSQVKEKLRLRIKRSLNNKRVNHER
jgi:hypothetical protein